MSYRILATQILTVHVLEVYCITDTYTCPEEFWQQRYLQYMAFGSPATQVLTVNVLEDS
jgi:hypothetical protein